MKKIIFLICGLVIAAAAQSEIISIPFDYSTIQYGINAANPGDTVLVEPGYYVENIDFSGKNITVASLFLITQDTAYISETVIDGSQAGSVVVFGSRETNSAVLCGFTITNGHAYHAGGIYMCNASPTLHHLRITENSASYSGGGLCCGYSQPVIKDVVLYENYALYSGGGAYFYYSSPQMSRIIVSNCWSDDCGGGVYTENSTCEFYNLSVINNFSIKGGGISFKNSDVNLVNARISDNNAEILGGGIKLENSNCHLINTLIAGNYSEMAAGGIFCLGSNPVLTNVTLADNASFECGGGIYCNDAEVVCNNTILWGNQPDEVYFELATNADQITFAYCNVENGEEDIITNNNGMVIWLDGNMMDDPQFTGTGKNPYSLSNGSPCVDAGTPDVTGLYLPETDLAGNHRIWDGDENGSAIIDIGPYEYGASVVGVIKPDITLNREFRIYPNPAVSMVTFEFENSGTYEVLVEITDQEGKRIALLSNGKQTTGVTRISWDAGGLTPGIYYCRIINGNSYITEKLMVIK